MMRVAIIGGYGNFGGYVARSLAARADIQLIIAGRSIDKAHRFAAALNASNRAETAHFDLGSPQQVMADMRPDLVINMVGPYNDQGYAIAEAATQCGAHYCDIADAREYVAGIGVLDDAAKEAGVAVLAGASSVPALMAAYLDEAVMEMRAIHSVEYGISGAEQANRGAGTVAAVLSYVGQRFTELRGGKMTEVTGWNDTRAVHFPELGIRWFGRGNVPDLELFKDRYPGLQNHSFWAGHEIALLHFSTRLMGALRQIRLLPPLSRLAPVLVRISQLFNWLGKGRSGFFMFIDGEDEAGAAIRKVHWIVARQGHGPYIPCIPAILVAKKLAEGQEIAPGARPCLDIISLAEYQAEFAGLDIEVIDQ